MDEITAHSASEEMKLLPESIKLWLQVLADYPIPKQAHLERHLENLIIACSCLLQVSCNSYAWKHWPLCCQAQ